MWDEVAATAGTGAADKAAPDHQTISDAEAVRFLLQAQFSATATDVANVQRLGYTGWLNQQFKAPQSQSAWGWLNDSELFIPTKEGNYFDPTHGDWMAWRQVMTGDDQMRKRLSLALSEMFVVSLDAVDGFWPPYVMAGYWDMLNASAFGNFRDLIEEVTLNPAMGLYLNTKGNLRENPATGREPDENYAREVMQLFTIGLYELNPDATPRVDAMGDRTETYTQTDITNLAHVFTGYDWDYTKCSNITVPWLPYPIPTPEFTRGRMAFHAGKHSFAPVTFLGVTIPAGTDGPQALKITLDTLFHHHNTGPFFCRQMIQRLVMSNPSPGYVTRVAGVFADNGSGTRGDLKAVWQAILTDPEARQLPAASDITAGKLREPMVRWIQWARTFNVASTDGKWAIGNTSAGDWALGQSPLRSPSVFNYFRPGYVPPHTAIATTGKVAPEFQIHNESTTAGYINFMAGAIKNGYSDVKPDYSHVLGMAPDARSLIDWLNLYLAANQLSPATTDVIETALNATPLNEASPDGDKLNRIHAAILLVMSSPEYLIQK